MPNVTVPQGEAREKMNIFVQSRIHVNERSENAIILDLIFETDSDLTFYLNLKISWGDSNRSYVSGNMKRTSMLCLHMFYFRILKMI